MSGFRINGRSRPAWIVVADESAAKFFSQDQKYSPISRVFGLKNETAQTKLGNLISDRGGRSFDSHGYGRHTLSTQTDPREYQSQRFADEIASRITLAMQQGDIGSFALIAAPRFLGMLRNALQKKPIDDPYLTISKDVVRHDIKAIENLLLEQ